MQKQGLKILTILLFALIPAVGYSQLNTNLLAKADSLFQQKRYTQSFEIFKALFDNRQYSPAMLLKMAYIQEGLNHISQAAYYLNLYYLTTGDKTSLTKLEELADKYRLEGYTRSEYEKAYAFYEQYKPIMSIALFVGLVFCFGLVAFLRLRLHLKPFGAWAGVIIFSIILFAHFNFNDPYAKGIIINNNTYLMNAPSAGASVVSIVRDGHRVNILGKEDVWLRVQWGDGEVYVKESNLQPIKL